MQGGYARDRVLKPRPKWLNGETHSGAGRLERRQCSKHRDHIQFFIQFITSVIAIPNKDYVMCQMATIERLYRGFDDWASLMTSRPPFLSVFMDLILLSAFHGTGVQLLLFFDFKETDFASKGLSSNNAGAFPGSK